MQSITVKPSFYVDAGIETRPLSLRKSRFPKKLLVNANCTEIGKLGTHWIRHKLVKRSSRIRKMRKNRTHAHTKTLSQFFIGSADHKRGLEATFHV